MSGWKVAGFASGGLAFVLCLVGLWWWALLGMEPDIATALAFTVLLFGTAAMFFPLGDNK